MNTSLGSKTHDNNKDARTNACGTLLLGGIINSLYFIVICLMF